MNLDPQHNALMAYLKSKDNTDIYHAKILELRETVQAWLEYVPTTFPHYTRHTTQHSDEIVLQLSKLLFRNEDPAKPVAQLSAIETYILVAAAYLHDVGMVVSDSEKAKLLESEDWRNWTREGAGAQRWHQIQELRSASEIANRELRNFLADVQIRFLIAELLRRSHHRRASSIIEQHQASLARFAFDDPILLRTISDVCVAHGIRQYELEDHERYPDRRDIRGEAANVRFIALLLRIGDLLDMSCDRACPLLLNAACPLPAESFAHWTQYQHITHRLTAPDKIELTAECHIQEEHQFLQDWCEWLIEEVREAGILMSHTSRHSNWYPPKATMESDGSSGTIVIRPAAHATYIPSNWTLQLDRDAVLQHLIHNVYESHLAFIQELIQNALDANRCKMYSDLLKKGIDPPEYPTQVDKNVRHKYPIQITLGKQEFENEMSGKTEERQVLTIEDCGIGMDRDIIENYFLQVGRSYYKTEEFRRNFRFVPASRFGIGFLSVFAVSDHVTIETYKPSSPRQDGPIQLTLRGPRSYLLTDRGERCSPGTRIEVSLRNPVPPGTLSAWVSDWCRRVEFPVYVDELGVKKTIESERPEHFTYEVPDVTEAGAKLAIQAFPIDCPGIEGEFYILARIDSRGESWDALDWLRIHYIGRHPQAVAPGLPESIICLHGIAGTDLTGASFNTDTGEASPLRIRLDCRGGAYLEKLAELGVNRLPWSNARAIVELIPDLMPCFERILKKHLDTSVRANSEEGWKYKQQIVSSFSMPPSFWSSCPKTIRIYRNDRSLLVSLKDVQSERVITTILRLRKIDSLYYWDSDENKSDYWYPDKAVKTNEFLSGLIDNSVPAIAVGDLAYVGSEYVKAIFDNRSVARIRWLNSKRLAIDWELSEERNILFQHRSYDIYFGVTDMLEPEMVGFEIHRIGYGKTFLLNADNSFVLWLKHVYETCEAEIHNLRKQQFSWILHRLPFGPDVDILKLTKFLEEWKNLPDLPSELYPPELHLSEDMFALRKDQIRA